jgi:hypothetical protein
MCSRSMSKDHDIAVRYRRHAEELRGAAAQALNVSIRAKLLVNARDYERMASSFDAVNQVNRAVRKRLNATFVGR